LFFGFLNFEIEITCKQILVLLVANFHYATFWNTFFLLDFKQFFNILTSQNKKYNKNWSFPTKYMDFFKVLTLWPFKA
jgi:hypothetical protein